MTFLQTFSNVTVGESLIQGLTFKTLQKIIIIILTIIIIVIIIIIIFKLKSVFKLIQCSR